MFRAETWAANRRRAAEPPLVYEQYDVSERYGRITMARNKQRKMKKTIVANEGLI